MDLRGDGSSQSGAYSCDDRIMSGTTEGKVFEVGNTWPTEDHVI